MQCNINRKANIPAHRTDRTSVRCAGTTMYFNILVYYFIFDADIYVIRIYFIVLLFQEDHFHQIQPTCNVSSVFIQHYMLAFLFMLHCIPFVLIINVHF